MPPQLQRALEWDPLFEPLPPPEPGDWLAAHSEAGQTFEDFLEAGPSAEASDRRIYIQPLGDLLMTSGQCLDHLAEFAEAFFVRQACLLPPVSLRDVRSRADPDTGGRQYFAGDVLRHLAADRPEDALCVVGVTAHDIYPDVFVSFAFGEASPAHRVGVCSIARYGPPYREEAAGQSAGGKLRRCGRLLAHEVCHLLGVQHCIFCRCLMNGSSDVAESDRRPSHLCPVDLRKLEWVLRFNVIDRYQRLLRFWSRAGDDEDAMWVSRRLRHVLDGWTQLTESR
jgi:archaemetzincin